MKIQVINNRLFRVILNTGKGGHKLEYVQKGNGRAPVVLGPNDYIPGLEPRLGVTAADFVRIQMDRTFPFKPAAAAAVEKFIEPPKPQPKTAGLDCLGKIGYALMELHEVTETLDLVMDSHMIDSIGGDAESFEKIRCCLHHLAPVIIEKTRELKKMSDDWSSDYDPHPANP